MDLMSFRLGTVDLAPHTPVVAGTVGQWKLVYTVGSMGIDEGGTLKFSQRVASDWETPQFDRPQASGYTTVTTTGAAKLRAYYHTKAHERPWMKCLVIDVYDGSLRPGDTVEVMLGDQRHGSPGIRAQTFQESRHEFRFYVDPTNAGIAKPLPTSPTFPIVPGTASTLICILPTRAPVGEEVPVFVTGEDAWGNPTPVPGDLTLTWQGEAEATIGDTHLSIHAEGTGWIVAQAATASAELRCLSNPITACEDKLGLGRYWGDLHAQTATTVGTGNEDEYFAFARDQARLDFASHQGNDFQIDDVYWAHLNRTVERFQDDGAFVVFPGYEWSANTPAGGDRNVFYRQEGQPILRSSHWQIPHVPEDEFTPAHPADILFARLRQRVGAEQVLVAAHVGGRYADIRRYFDQELGSLVEVLSCWGVFEWLLWDAFDQGYVVGVMCNSDGHKGRPGAEGPGAGEFGIRSGLTCVLAEELTRDSVFAALKSRRCYGTSGPRIDLSFDVNGYAMGSAIDLPGKCTASAAVRCTAPLESLVLFQGRVPLHIVRPAAFSEQDQSRRVRVSWQGARIRGRGRRVTWDGAIRVQDVSIRRAVVHAFDAKSDGILGQTDREITFKSATTGDMDGIDLYLDATDRGTLIFESEVGCAHVNLAELRAVGEEKLISFGGLDIQLRVQRYPQQLVDYTAKLELELDPPADSQTPYFVKVVQEDGHMAWSSPIYIRR